MQPSPEEAARALREIDQNHRRVRRSVAPRWPVALAGFAVFGAIGLTRDLAPDWFGAALMAVGGLGLALGLIGRTRRGAALLGRRVQPRAAGAGIAASSKSRDLLIRTALVVLSLAAAVVVGVSVVQASSGQARSWWPGGLPHTVEWIAVATLVYAVLRGYGGWLGRGSEKA